MNSTEPYFISLHFGTWALFQNRRVKKITPDILTHTNFLILYHFYDILPFHDRYQYVITLNTGTHQETNSGFKSATLIDQHIRKTQWRLPLLIKYSSKTLIWLPHSYKSRDCLDLCWGYKRHSIMAMGHKGLVGLLSMLDRWWWWVVFSAGVIIFSYSTFSLCRFSVFR